MCRNIRTLFNFEPPATEEEIRASALQFVRKLSGFAKPSRANEEPFNRAVEEVAEAARRLLRSLETASPARDREIEAAKARAGSRARAVCMSEDVNKHSPRTGAATFAAASCGWPDPIGERWRRRPHCGAA